ncbi:abortive infection family protein [Paucisalibacillus sp. EB02]|uniref:abortive infection family protein n=1 Tax=Paucisalibacillus sp. EB02 TaxID=1347087 RepID=UPI0004B3188C|nr:abortive infection family protein [Paucisalibacillus sp. EB02]
MREKNDEMLQDYEEPSLEEDFNTEIEKAEYLQRILINVSTNDGPYSEEHYVKLRKHFINGITTKNLLPSFVINNRDTSQFWHFIKNRFSTYAERRQFIWNEFTRLIDYFEAQEFSPIDESIDKHLKVFSSDYVLDYWKRAIERKENDPEGAITLSRSLMEAVLKHILEEKNIGYSNSADLHEIYKQVTNELNLTPEKHDVKIFKQILGGCSAVVSGLGNLRNSQGDAHGKGKNRYYKPSSRHAELAVNLAGSMCLFLIQTLKKTE